MAPHGIGMDEAGDFVVPDIVAPALFRVTPQGTITAIASGLPFATLNAAAPVSVRAGSGPGPATEP